LQIHFHGGGLSHKTETSSFFGESPAGCEGIVQIIVDIFIDDFKGVNLALENFSKLLFLLINSES
jgi:hypothetical protein